MNEWILGIVLVSLILFLGFLIGYGVGYNKGLKPQCDKLRGEIINNSCVKVLI